jgi:nicotinamide-nucleotide adenylyltransferase
MQKFPTGLLPGRFQPLHKGHIGAIRWSLARCKQLIIMVGTANESRTRKNPFSASERIQMLKRSIPPSLLSRCKIIPLRDIPDDSKWVAHLQKNLPRFDAVFSANPLVKKLAEGKGLQVLIPPYLRRAELEGTKIRKLMLAGKKWRNRVPTAVSRMLEGKKLQALLAKLG